MDQGDKPLEEARSEPPAASPRQAHPLAFRKPWTPLVLACCGLGLVLLAVYGSMLVQPSSERETGPPSATPASGQIGSAPLAVNLRTAYTLQSAGALFTAWS